MAKSAQKKLKITRRKKPKILIIGVIFFIIFFLISLLIISKNALPKKIISPIPQNVLSNNTLNVLSEEESLKKLSLILKRNNISFSSLSEYDKNSFAVKLKSGEEIIFSSQKNLEYQTSSLQVILSRLTIEGKRFSRLDFRFEKPVITLK